MLVTSKVKMSDSEKKVDRKTFSISPKFYVVVVQNNGKEMYKKLCCTCMQSTKRSLEKEMSHYFKLYRCYSNSFNLSNVGNFC